VAVSTKQVLLLGMMPGMTRDELTAARDFMQAKFPDMEVRVLVGMLSAYAFETEYDDEGDDPPNLEGAQRKGGYL
jgi:hypothetical protein